MNRVGGQAIFQYVRIFRQRFELVVTASANNSLLVASYSYVANRKKSLRRVVLMGLEAELSATSGGRISLANGSEGGRPASEQQEQESHFDTPPRVVAKGNNFVILNRVMLSGVSVREAN